MPNIATNRARAGGSGNLYGLRQEFQVSRGSGIPVSIQNKIVVDALDAAIARNLPVDGADAEMVLQELGIRCLDRCSGPTQAVIAARYAGVGIYREPEDEWASGDVTVSAQSAADTDLMLLSLPSVGAADTDEDAWTEAF